MGIRNGEPLVFPLGLAYIASALREKHELCCYDPNVFENPFQELSIVIDKFNPDVVAVSLRNLDNVFSFNKRSYYPEFKRLVRQIKQQKPDCKVVVGGAGFSIFAEEIIKDNPEIDFGIISEGENSFPQLIINLDHPEQVPGVVFRKNGQTVAIKQKPVAFDSLPKPSRELFIIKKYQKALFSIGVQSKRGCGFNCVFCSKRIQGGNTCRMRPAKKVVDEIECLVNNFGVSTCFFVDSTFNFPFSHCEEICKEIVKRRLDVRWSADFRPDFLNEYLMKLCVKAGCNWFGFSPDGACDSAMKMLGKNFGVQQVKKTFELARKTEGANVGYSFLHDLPFHNQENTLGLLRMVSKMMFLCGKKLRYVTFSKVRIYPRTKFYQIALEQGKIDSNTNLLYPTYYRSGSRIQVENFLPQALRDASMLFLKVSARFRRNVYPANEQKG
jgi:anaerobic magnesium-protoporphyrin IX monomethyl ester cyclase